jgi:hypothetical protein
MPSFDYNDLSTIGSTLNLIFLKKLQALMRPKPFKRYRKVFKFLYQNLAEFVQILVMETESITSNGKWKSIQVIIINTTISYLEVTIDGQRCFLIRVPWAFFAKFLFWYVDNIGLKEGKYSRRRKNKLRKNIRCELDKLGPRGLCLKTLDTRSYFYFLIVHKQ